jgi:hypothetical protein
MNSSKLIEWPPGLIGIRAATTNLSSSAVSAFGYVEKLGGAERV